MGWIKREKRRARRLVFKSPGTPNDLEDSAIDQAEPNEYEDAIVGDIDKSPVQEPLNL
jgi:hypothetical protein